MRNNLGLRWRAFSFKKKISIVLAVILVLAVSAGALGYFSGFFSLRQVVSIDPTTGDIIVKEEKPPKLESRINILLIATDQRDNSQSYNTDSLILASIDPKTEQISMLSIPRDTRVTIPKYGMNKINSAAAFGGLNMTVAVVQQLTGVKIDGYIKTNFQGFKNIIDTLGGISINVEKNMYYETGDKEDGIINLKKGEQVLDGSKALQYARFRHDTYGDITRTARQQVVLKAVAKKMLEPGNLSRIPILIPQFYRTVVTNLPLADLINMAKVLAKYDSSKAVSQTLPGYFLDIDGISYWGVNPDEVKKVVAQVFNGIVTANTPEAVIKGSETIITTKPDEDIPLEEPKPQVKIGAIGIDYGKTTHSSITIMVTASTGIGRAEVWRTGSNVPIYPKKGQTWSGESVTFADSGLHPNTEYSYWLKVYDLEDTFLQATNPVTGKTKSEADEEEPLPAPILSVAAPNDNIRTNKKLINITGAAQNVNSVTVKVDSQNEITVVVNNGSFSTAVNLDTTPNKVNTITITATNESGSSEVIRKVIYDSSPPEFEFDTSISGNIVSVNGTTEPKSTVIISINNEKFVEFVSNDGNFAKEINLENKPPGSYVITITATDTVGNTSAPVSKTVEKT